MAKDERLYARFDIGMDEHPKIMMLSDAAFRALHEATYYSRRQRSDGFIRAEIAVRKWGADSVAELCANDPEKPSLFSTTKSGVPGYQIHDFDKHQTTNADIDRKREAGKIGANARWKSGSDANRMRPGKRTDATPVGITETDTDTETDTSTSKEVERPAKRGSRLSPDWLPSTESIAKAKDDAPDVDHKSEHSVFVDYWIAQPGQKGVKTNWDSTWRNWMRRKQTDLNSRAAKPTPEQRARQTLTLATDIDMKGIAS